MEHNWIHPDGNMAGPLHCTKCNNDWYGDGPMPECVNVKK